MNNVSGKNSRLQFERSAFEGNLATACKINSDMFMGNINTNMCEILKCCTVNVR